MILKAEIPVLKSKDALHKPFHIVVRFLRSLIFSLLRSSTLNIQSEDLDRGLDENRLDHEPQIEVKLREDFENYVGFPGFLVVCLVVLGISLDKKI